MTLKRRNNPIENIEDNFDLVMLDGVFKLIG